MQIGPGVEGLKVGDRVVMGSSQAGTWASYMNIKADTLIPIGNKISDVQGATLCVSANIRM